MDALGLSDYFFERFAIAGTPQQVINRLALLHQIGIEQVNLNAWGTSDMNLLGNEVLPGIDRS
jgi:alkanesulfonate monooxygenase SsuD/methylene tetrahydromethanopterin reductase-like flavin-dependent oxidoreductase (luciferase family)